MVEENTKIQLEAYNYVKESYAEWSMTQKITAYLLEVMGKKITLGQVREEIISPIPSRTWKWSTSYKRTDSNNELKTEEFIIVLRLSEQAIWTMTSSRKCTIDWILIFCSLHNRQEGPCIILVFDRNSQEFPTKKELKVTERV